MEVRIQSVVVEFILNNVDVLFSAKLSSLIREGAGESTHDKIMLLTVLALLSLFHLNVDLPAASII